MTICWLKAGRRKEVREAIRKRFGISDYMSVNYETPCEIREEDMDLLRETARRGFVELRFKS